METKKCEKCCEVLPKTSEYFHYLSTKRNTFKKICKKCSNRQKPYKWQLVLDTGLKTCSKCEIEKPVELFSKNKTSKDGYASYCIECYDLHFVKPKHEERKSYWREHYQDNSEKRKKDAREYFEENKEKIREYKKDYYESNKEVIKAKVKKRHYDRRENDELYDLICHMRVVVYRYIKNKSKRTMDIIGCSPEELRSHIESLWQPDMTWDNHTHDGWHIDHIKPLSSATTEEEIYMLNHYTNLQPLWAADNLRKGDKIIS
jgi:hypothetical protein